MNERREGWYWIKVDEEVWEPGEWFASFWRVKETEDTFEDWELIEIGPRIPTPDEDWQYVPSQPTEEMQRAYFDATAINLNDPTTAWLDMLEAAPSPDDEP